MKRNRRHRTFPQKNLNLPNSLKHVLVLNLCFISKVRACIELHCPEPGNTMHWPSGPFPKKFGNPFRRLHLIGNSYHISLRIFIFI